MDDGLVVVIIMLVIGISAMFCYFTYANVSKGVDLAGVQIQCPSNKVVGLYDQYSKMIIVETKGKTPGQVEDILLHEYKHFLQDANLNGGYFQASPEDELEASLYEQTHYIAEVLK